MDLIVTKRLRLRPLTPADAVALHAYRSDPAVAQYMTWKLPYSLRQAEDYIAEVIPIGGFVAGEWYVLGIESAETGELIGDVAAGRHARFPTAEIGYSVAPGHQGTGLATEAVEALVGHLFDEVGMERLEAMIDPRNVASEMLLERIGFQYEGNRVESFFNDPEWSDDGTYGLRRIDRSAWLARSRQRPSAVRLVEVTPDNLRQVIALRTHHSQERFVAPVVTSLADAAVPPVENGAPVEPWFRAIAADGELVGFVMLARRTSAHPTTWLWRLLIDRRFQRRGIATMVLDQLAGTLRSAGETTLRVSYRPGRGTPAQLYLRYGFVPTGAIGDGEIIADLTL